MTKLIINNKFLFYAALLLGLILLYPTVELHGFLSTGDHGRDYYAFERTLLGDVPYQDYWWVYGPLMPYYYAAFLKLLGINMMSVLLAKMLLDLGSGLFIFLTLRTLFSPGTALLGALWFWVFHYGFFFTHNHSGGITAVTAIMFFMARYIRTRSDRWLWGGTAAALALAFIKPNFGAAGLLALALTAFATDLIFSKKHSLRKTFFYLFAVVIIPAMVFAAYWILLHGLTLHEIRQCLPYAGTDRPYDMSVFNALIAFLRLFTQRLFSGPVNFLFGAVILFSVLRTFKVLIQRATPQDTRKTAFLVLFLFGAYYVLNLHEYLKSGVIYRSFWAQPIGIVWMFAVVAIARGSVTKWARAIVTAVIFFLLTITVFQQRVNVNILKDPAHYLEHPRAKVFVQNDPAWIRTVEQTTGFLNKTLLPGEQFLAVPYDPLYYYLTGRKSPTRLLIFFDHINIPPEQEERIIRDLENNKVNYILLSSRLNAPEIGLGVFGKTCCPRLGAYVERNFRPLAQFGDWANVPGWNENHGTVILKRKAPAKSGK